MTQSEFFKIKTSGKPIGFAELIELKQSEAILNSDFLLDFCKRMHPSGYVRMDNGKCRVLSNTTYTYELYPSCIIRTKQPRGYTGTVELKIYDLPENVLQ
jgi:hypothetical protein